MGDLIDREELKKAAKRIESLPWGDEEGNRVEFQWSPKELEYLIDKAPSAEKKGKWERSDDPWKAVCSFAPCKTAICSVCKLDTFDRIDYAKKHYKFCPFCGAKMEVEG